MKSSERLRLPREQVIAGIECGKATLDEVRASIRSLHECLQFGAVAVENEEINLKKSDDEQFVYCKILSIETEILTCLRVNAVRLYNASTHTIRYTPESSSESEQVGKECLGDRLVEVHLAPDGIFIRLPMLGSRNSRPGKAKLNQTNASIFRDAIVYAIEHNSCFLTYDFARFDDKIIQFLYVYNLDKGSCSHRIIDNDNHDTKAIQDAVALYLPGGDYGLTCSNYSESVLSKEVPEGTYITVIEAKSGVKPSSEIIQKWVGLLEKS